MKALPDAVREARIAYLAGMAKVAPTPETRRAWWSALRRAIAARSPEQIARMERQKGLR